MRAVEQFLHDAADPLWAATVVERLIGSANAAGHHRIVARLADDERFARAVVALADASRSLSEAVVRDPALLDVIDDTAEQEPTELSARLVARCVTASDPKGELRRAKRTELLRIALADLLGEADLAAVAQRLAYLADGCLSVALALAGPSQPMAIVGMGKLGGLELNYASDVDVLFVHDGDEFEAGRVARKVIAAMSENTADGIVFRTDADLRPDGKAGPLSRTVNAYRAYYEERALNWERVALIKSRRVTGDADLAAQFFDACLPALWEGPPPPDAVRDIQAMKARSENLLAQGGLFEREVKRGRGGIRDIEFAVQLLQFVHGRHDPAIRSPTTLTALDQLARHGYVDGADAEHLATAYRYLRTVEHRLQLEREQQVYALPADETALGRLARVLGYRDRDGQTAKEQFEETHRRHQASARSIHERLFFRPLLDALAGGGPLRPELLAEQLAAFGFRDLAATRAAVEELTMGMGRSAIQLRVMFPSLLGWLSAAPNPDLGLLQLRIVLDGPVRASTVVPAIRESPVVAERLCWLLGASKVVGQGLRHHPELVADLAESDRLTARGETELLAEATESLAWRGDVRAGREEGLRRFKRRAETRIACRHLLGLASSADVAAELTALADAGLGAYLDALAPGFPFAIVGMGKLGGRELAFPSDLDVFFVHDGPQPEAEALAATLIAEIGGTTSAGRAWEIDARLRPEGNLGVLARSLRSCEEYYARWGRLWERQALIKARVVAGDGALGSRFEALRDGVSYAGPLSEAELAEIRHIKGRVERERFRPGDDPSLHLKLGPGGMVDVEFTVQLLQLRLGWSDPALRTPSTRDGLAALVAAGTVDSRDAEVLLAAYDFCEQLRNAWFLRTGAKRDTVPTAPEELRDLARLVRCDDVLGEYRGRTRAARVVVEHLFYER